jgi:tetratricopeptide (TPR) repeat protein
MNPPAATPEELLDLAEAALHQGRPDAVLELCRQLLELQPDNAAALFLEAEALREMQEPEAATWRYRRVLDLQPSHADAWSGLGLVLFEQMAFDEALSAFQRAVRLAPDNADAHFGRAMVRERRGDLAGARRAYLRAWRLSSAHPAPADLSDADVTALLREAALRDDPLVAAWLDHVPIIVAEVPDDATCASWEPLASPSGLLGHFSSPQLDEATGRRPSMLTPVVLYRRNIARLAFDRDHVIDELGHTVVRDLHDWLDTGDANA